MPREKYPPTTAPMSPTAYPLVIAWHARQIMLFRSRGEGLRLVSSVHAALLLASAAGAAALCAAIAPGGSSQLGPVALGLLVLAMGFSLMPIGKPAIAGLAVVVLATEPVALLLRYLPAGSLLDAVFSAWVVAAIAVFGGKCAQSRLEAK